LITAGPTREYIDPVRFISNPSTGKMGYALASSVCARGHQAILVSGPTCLEAPRRAKTIPVISADDMHRAVFENLQGVDAVIMAAAVSDFKPASHARLKIKKDRASLHLALKRNPDILHVLGKMKHSYYLVGFAAETDHVMLHAQQKLLKKNLDMIVANRVDREDTGFGSDFNEAVLLFKEGKNKRIAKTSKTRLADVVVREILSHIDRGQPSHFC